MHARITRLHPYTYLKISVHMSCADLGDVTGLPPRGKGFFHSIRWIFRCVVKVDGFIPIRTDKARAPSCRMAGDALKWRTRDSSHLRARALGQRQYVRMHWTRFNLNTTARVLSVECIFKKNSGVHK